MLKFFGRNVLILKFVVNHLHEVLTVFDSQQKSNFIKDSFIILFNDLKILIVDFGDNFFTVDYLHNIVWAVFEYGRINGSKTTFFELIIMECEVVVLKFSDQVEFFCVRTDSFH